jgi:pimeloyl-ACP methyl ester carboxylesterase
MSEIVTEEFMIPAGDPGIEVYVRNKRLRNVARFDGKKVLLFVHGSTFPAETVFDLELNGVSWMGHIAQQGYDVYLVDVRGYGRSTRPPEMSAPPEANPPIVRTDTAVADIGAAVDFILERRGISKLNLMGWSWGTTIMATYTTRNNARVNKLVLNAPQWMRPATASLQDADGGLGAWRLMTKEGIVEHWLGGVPAAKKADVVPAAWFDALVAAAFASDPEYGARNPPALRAPNGTLLDRREFWMRGRSLYDPAEIRVPTLLTHAEWDNALPAHMPQALFTRLVNAPYKRYVEFSEGTHYLMLEKIRVQVFREVQLFLDEAALPEA